MKTTVELPDDLLAAAKRLAAQRGETFKQVLELSLRRTLAQEHKSKREFRLRDASFTGRGLIKEMDWAEIRDLIYEGRGT